MFLANSAPHTRRRVVRVMVVMCVPGQHKKLDYANPSFAVNPENWMITIGFADNSYRRELKNLAWSAGETILGEPILPVHTASKKYLRL